MAQMLGLCLPLLRYACMYVHMYVYEPGNGSYYCTSMHVCMYMCVYGKNIGCFALSGLANGLRAEAPARYVCMYLVLAYKCV